MLPHGNSTHDKATDPFPALEREQLTLSNVQIDSWLAARESFNQFASRSATNDALLTATILRTILSKYLWRRPEAIDFVQNPSGRAFLRHDTLGRPLYFSCTTTPRYVAIIVSREPRIGIEIVDPAEASTLIPQIEAEIAPVERDALAGLSPSARVRGLLSIWTRKRALQQANAVARVEPLVSIAAGLGELALELPSSFGWLHRWRLHSFTLRTREIGSLAVYRHDQLLVVGAGDRRNAVRPNIPAEFERRRVLI
jgi:hypothetical protein